VRLEVTKHNRRKSGNQQGSELERGTGRGGIIPWTAGHNSLGAGRPRRVGAGRLARISGVSRHAYSPSSQVSRLPPPNPACDFHRTGLSRARHSSPGIATGSVSRFDFAEIAAYIPAAADARLRRAASATFLIRVALPLAPFALWPAFPASEYYGTSDAAQVSPPDCRAPFQGSLPRSRGWTLQGRLGGGLYE
jgi:hypothetical protein